MTGIRTVGPVVNTNGSRSNTIAGTENFHSCSKSKLKLKKILLCKTVLKLLIGIFTAANASGLSIPITHKLSHNDDNWNYRYLVFKQANNNCETNSVHLRKT